MSSLLDGYVVGATIELIGRFFDYPLRVDWDIGVRGKIVGQEQDAHYLVDLGEYTPMEPMVLKASVFRIIQST